MVQIGRRLTPEQKAAKIKRLIAAWEADELPLSQITQALHIGWGLARAEIQAAIDRGEAKRPLPHRRPRGCADGNVRRTG